jgi:hypothetical protein
MAGLLVAGAVLAGCFDPKLDDLGLSCGTAGCPTGAVCDGRNACRPDLPDSGENVVLALARAEQPGQIFSLCDGLVLPVGELLQLRGGRAVAWGDPDGDGEPGLAFANLGDAVHLLAVHRGSIFDQDGAIDAAEVRAAAWGDQDGDGDVDLALSDHESSVSVLRYEDGGLVPFWSAPDIDEPFGLAWGDLDGDGDLDLAVATTAAAQVFRNDGDALAPAWAGAVEATRAVSWADVDGDGDLDLVTAARDAPVRVYRNDGGTLTEAWASDGDDGEALATGDMDGDGDIDLAVGNREVPSRVYRNDGRGDDPAFTVVWETERDVDTNSIQWFDVDGDGALDLTLGNRSHPSRLHFNRGGTLDEGVELSPFVRSLEWVRWPVPAGDASACDAARW